jgi:predicted RNase H-like HicB family nuclease
MKKKQLEVTAMETADTFKGAQDYLSQPYARILTPNGAGGYTAEILEFPGCVTEGGTPDEAMRNLEEAAVSWIEGTLAQGNEIPEPMENIGYSGKFPLRLPRSLHREAARMAALDNVSVNTFIVTAIAARVGAENLLGLMARRHEQRLIEKTEPYTVRKRTIQIQEELRRPTFRQPREGVSFAPSDPTFTLPKGARGGQ